MPVFMHKMGHMLTVLAWIVIAPVALYLACYAVALLAAGVVSFVESVFG